jgi:integrase
MAEGTSIWQYTTAKGKKWAIEARHPQANTKIQRRGFSTAAEAQRHAKQLRLELIQRGKPAADSRIKLGQLAEEYFSSLEGSVRPHTLANYRYTLVKYFLPTFKHLYVADIVEPQLTELLVSLSKRGLFPGTVNTIRARIIGLFSYAVRRRLLQFNPAKETRCVRRLDDSQTAVRERLSASEARELLERAKGTELDVFIALCLGLGMRKGEALGIRIEDVDLESGLIFIRRSRGQQRYSGPDGKMRCREEDGLTKTESSTRAVPINRIVLEAIMRSAALANRQQGDYLVSSPSGLPMSLSMLHKRYKGLYAVDGLRYVRIHDLRHSAAHLSLEAKAPLEAVSQALGHSSLEVTKRIYAPKVRLLDDLFSSALADSLSPELRLSGGDVSGMASKSLGN